MNRFTVLVLASALTLVSTSANAQRTSQIETGVRVRVTRTHGSPLVGAFIGADADSVRVMGEGSRPTIRSTLAGDVSKIEVSRGRSRAKGALIKGLIGLGIGAASGAILGAATYSDNNSTVCTANLGCGPAWCIFICSKSQAAGLVGILGGAAGLVIGTVAGAVAGQEQWQTAPLRRDSVNAAKASH